MEFDAIFTALTERFGPDALLGHEADAIDPWVVVAPDHLRDVCLFLRDTEPLVFDHLNNLTVVDYCEPDPKKASRFPFETHLEVVYHLTSFNHRGRLTLKVSLPRWENDEPGQLPSIPSVADIWGSADWHEREAFDLLGVNFTGHPNLRRILMPDDWPGHPLRKDYVWPDDYHGIRTQ